MTLGKPVSLLCKILSRNTGSNGNLKFNFICKGERTENKACGEGYSSVKYAS